MTNLENWPEWTTVILSAKGELKQSGKLTLEYANPDGESMVFERTIFQFEEGKQFAWTGEAFKGLKDYHIHQLEELEDDKTRFTQSDGLHGADVPGKDKMEQQMP